jgi:Flp pilus assembly protein TadG
MSFLKDKRASMPIAFLYLFLVVFLILAGMAIEYGRAAAIKRNVEDGLSKALNDAVQMAMLDDYRQEHISRIDFDIANAEAVAYMSEVLGLDAPAYTVQQSGGRTLYRLENVTITTEIEPPHMTLTCTLVVPMSMFSSMTGELDLRLDVRVDSRNQRLEPDP